MRLVEIKLQYGLEKALINVDDISNIIQDRKSPNGYKRYTTIYFKNREAGFWSGDGSLKTDHTMDEIKKIINEEDID